MELAIDTVGITSSVAVSDAGQPVAEITWPSGRRHTPTLVPMIDAVCRNANVERAEIAAVFVDLGPGAYGGIRAGMAAAAGLASALSIPTVGINRLEIECYAHAAASGAARSGPIVALHNAGRGQLAVAAYLGPAAHWREETAPALMTPARFADHLQGLGEVGVLCGELDRLGAAGIDHLSHLGWTVAGPAASMRRASLLAELAWRVWQRALAAGRDLTPDQLEPFYMRDPAIGPQSPVVEEPFPVRDGAVGSSPNED
ncbi:MAG TPA: tRNA (adenosine(37)-N6)-threonylcarbamoyltransferase complex dimerization subunit type 1 TsaB [Dehalococcoidia bacterium]|nr:tRNA (adenosine(37)-N6)-threonylcarbamoyltransferase complex dimerization subunit type 1 TsaB [Dehalococcoidia bacterium]